jgi:hypothetical protein
MDKVYNRRSRHIAVELFLCSVPLLLFQTQVLATQSVVLVWTPSICTNVAGYRVYYGLASHAYGGFVTVGQTNTAVISGLADGTVYYFAATTRDVSGNESPLSNELVYQVPSAAAKMTTLTLNHTSNLQVQVPSAAARLTALKGPDGQFSFTVSGVSGSQYVVQSSTNLVNWVSVQTNASPFTFTDTSTVKLNQCYFRTIYLPP